MALQFTAKRARSHRPRPSPPLSPRPVAAARSRRKSHKSPTPAFALEESLSELSYQVASLPELVSDGSDGVAKVQLATSAIILCVQFALALQGGRKRDPEYEEALEHDIVHLKNQVIKEKERFEARDAEREEGVSSLKAKVEELAAEITSTEDHLAEARTQIAALEGAQASMLEDQVQSVTEEVEYIQILQEKYERVSDEVETLRQRIEEVEREREEEREATAAAAAAKAEAEAYFSPEAMRGKPPPSLPEVTKEKKGEKKKNARGSAAGSVTTEHSTGGTTAGREAL